MSINDQTDDQNKKLPAAPGGNASNPSPREGQGETQKSQLLSEKAGKYLRESANPEDYPDADDQAESDKDISSLNP